MAGPSTAEEALRQSQQQPTPTNTPMKFRLGKEAMVTHNGVEQTGVLIGAWFRGREGKWYYEMSSTALEGTSGPDAGPVDCYGGEPIPEDELYAQTNGVSH